MEKRELELGEGVGNSYEVAVSDALHRAASDPRQSDPKQECWKVETVIVKVGNPHIKEYKVTVVPGGSGG
jgi:hypothetical protein